MDRFHALALHGCVGNELVESLYLHAETVGDTRHVAAYLTEGIDTERFLLQLCARLAVVLVAAHHHHHTEHKLGNGVGVLARCVHHADAVSCGCRQVDIVIAGAGADNHFQLGSRVHHFAIDFVGTYYQAVGVLYSLKQVSACTALHHLEIVARCVDSVLYSLDCRGGKRLLGENQYFHGLSLVF